PTFAPVRAGLFVALWFGYEPGLTAYAATLGQRLMGLRVRRVGGPTRRVSPPAGWLRCVLKLGLRVISFRTLALSRERRAIHDFASGSVVLDARAPSVVAVAAPSSAT